MPVIVLSFIPDVSKGAFTRGVGVTDSIWVRLKASARELDVWASTASHRVELSWPAALSLLRTLSALQTELGFDFDTDDSSAQKVEKFLQDYRAMRRLSGGAADSLPLAEIDARLANLGWNHHSHRLKPYQAENLRRLLALGNGANFSVPGAGKTTVSFALHLLLGEKAGKLLIVAPRNAFPAWESVVDECLLPEAPAELRESFQILSGGESRIRDFISQPYKRFVISYDQLVRVDSLIENFLAVNQVHLVLDESHRMKGGHAIQRGAALLRMGHLAVRRDILTGTPMPQSSTDLQSQLDFLWPGGGLGARISTGEAPRDVLGALYVRTTKSDLGLPARERVFVQVELSPAHLAFYSVLREDVRAQASILRTGQSAVALIHARHSVVRLLQAAVNPELVVSNLQDSTSEHKAGLLRAVLAEGPSARVRAAASQVERLVGEGKKVLVWSIYTSTINQLRQLLSHMNPALIYGEIGVGDEADDATRQGQIRRFKTDPKCSVMIANPAAAAEGISLHMHCHDAIYVDRSYNATHFLQSIDRIHRLGLPQDTKTTVYVLQNKLPSGVGSIDLSVSRRLAAKIRNMERLLEDPDLNALAFDEESAPLAIDQSIDAQDIDDLVAELEGRGPFVSGDELA